MRLRTPCPNGDSCGTMIGGRPPFDCRARLRGRLRPTGLAAVALFCAGLLATPAAAQGVVGTVPGRVGGSMAALVALVGVVIGGLAWSRSRRDGATANGSGHDGAIVALVLGLVGVFLAVVHLATSTGGIGTGSGKAGAMVAVVLGVIGVLLGRQALSRSGGGG